MKDESKIKDWRSTGRRKGRRSLYNSHIEYRCKKCTFTTKLPPKDAPPWFEEIWPEELRVLDSQLQVQHKTKDVTQNDEDDLEWLCPSCHKIEDLKTEVGVSLVEKKNWFDDSPPQPKPDSWF
jgi:hypothetical protein